MVGYIGECERMLGAIRRGETVWHPALGARQTRAAVIMARDLGGVLGGPIAIDGLHRLRDIAVQPHLPRRAQPLVERVAHEGMREVVRRRRRARGDQQLRGQRRVERIQRGPLVHSRYPPRHLEVDPARERRRHAQELARRSRQAREAPSDHLPHGVGQPQALHRGGFGPGLAAQRALLGEMQQDLAEEERVAAGFPCERFRPCPRNHPLRERLHQRADGRRVEPAERELLVARFSRQRAEDLSQRMVRRHLDVAIRTEHEQPRTGCEARHVLQQRDRPRVGPVEIVQHQHGLHPRGQREQRLRDGVKQPHVLRVGLESLRLGYVRQALPNRGHESGEGRGVESEIGAQHIGLGGAGVLAERLREGPERSCSLTLVAPTPQDERTLRPRRVCHFLEQARLAYSRLAPKQDLPALAGARFLQPPRQPPQLCRAPRKRRMARRRFAGVGAVGHLVPRHALREAIQLPCFGNRERQLTCNDNNANFSTSRIALGVAWCRRARAGRG